MIHALSIAGFDGSAGAGILADVKTMAYFGVYGQAVCTALTEQNEDEFVAPNWVAWDRIETQLGMLFKKHAFGFVKIGLVENVSVLKKIVGSVRAKSPDAFVVWDPIVSATSGFCFLNPGEKDEFVSLLKFVDLVTPNMDEFRFLGLKELCDEGKFKMGRDCAVLLKGGHTDDADAVDTLWTRDGVSHCFASPRVAGAGKHGTGCNLSSAILANVALGKTLPEACRTAKAYMDRFIVSGDGRLGFVVK